MNNVLKANSSKKFTGIANIQTEIMTNGPVQATFTVYDDFFSYKLGI